MCSVYYAETTEADRTCWERIKSRATAVGPPSTHRRNAGLPFKEAFTIEQLFKVEHLSK